MPKKLPHRLFAVVKMSDGDTYHVFAREETHQSGHRYDGDLPTLLRQAFGFAGSKSDYCRPDAPKFKPFQQDNVDWHPRFVNWSHCVSFAALQELGHLDHKCCEYYREKDSPFRDRLVRR
jgi:hypothetical protein